MSYLLREKHLKKLQTEQFDVLVIGGGATGAGILLDAASRGLKAALIEAEDFASGTSSRSTKLFHGGMRYLELAFKHLDYSQYSLVKQALHERGVLLKLAPHLTRALPIVIPLYSNWEALYHWAGVKIYDKLSGELSIGKSCWVSSEFFRHHFPHVNQEGLKGGVLFYDGQFNDSRMNISLILTAISIGATALNYVELAGFEKRQGKIAAAKIKDHLTGNQWSISARHFVNATGPGADLVRQLDEPEAVPAIAPSRGTHIVLEQSLVPNDMGLLVPKTEDGRLLFLLPWQGRVLVGTTDVSASNLEMPNATSEEIEYLRHHLQKYLGIQIQDGDIKAAWAGLRPLLKQGGVDSSARRTRDFKIEISDAGLISVMGGKWTSYRKMGEKTVDFISSRPCLTESTVLLGGQNFNSDFVEKIKRKSPLEPDIIEHLLQAYGDRVEEVLAIAKNGLEKRLAEGYPYIGAEVVYVCRHEYAVKPEDVIFRRIPLGILDQSAAAQVLPKISDIMKCE